MCFSSALPGRSLATLKVRHRGIGNGWRLEASSRAEGILLPEGGVSNIGSDYSESNAAIVRRFSDFGERLGSAGKCFLADVGIAMGAHGRAFMAGGAPCLVKGTLAPRSPPTIGTRGLTRHSSFARETGYLDHDPGYERFDPFLHRGLSSDADSGNWYHYGLYRVAAVSDCALH